MQVLSQFLKNENLRIVWLACEFIIWITIAGLLLITLLHTLTLVGRQTILYKKRQPVDGWSKRFYPAILLLIVILFCVLWLLKVVTAVAK